MDSLPKDPAILFSWLNTMLRDNYSTLSELCESLDIDQKGLIERMEVLGFSYMPELNQFR